MTSIDPTIVKELENALEARKASGTVLSEDELGTSYARFKERFGPEVLRKLSGKDLLLFMHNRPDKGSLAYWLEFKEDAEFITRHFGSIKGGSAHKFGIFKFKTGEWKVGSATKQRVIELSEAIEFAETQKKQLLSSVKLLEDLADNATDAEYEQLQEDLDSVAPDFSSQAWGHKYLSLLFPNKLDDFHREQWQRYHLIKTLQTPSEKRGHYSNAGKFLRLAHELDWPINHFATALNERNAKPSKYWRIGTKVGGEEDLWPLMQTKDAVAIGWCEIGDLSDCLGEEGAKAKIRQRLVEQYYHEDSESGTATRKAGEIDNFINKIAVGDIVIAGNGQTVLGIGRIGGNYFFDESTVESTPHRRTVEWLNSDEWKMPVFEGQQTTVYELRKYPEVRIEIEKRIVGVTEKGTSEREGSIWPMPLNSDIEENHVFNELTESPNHAVILQGPAGTGKTWVANQVKDHYEAKGGKVVYAQFHPAYTYEDFIEGLRPRVNKESNQLEYNVESGVFKKFCEDADAASDKTHLFIIDEINRGNIPKIFGEIMRCVEYRSNAGEGPGSDSTVSLPYSQEPFSIPNNVHILGTMNTSDRSIAMLDIALRRRFSFIDIMPDPSVVEDGLLELDDWEVELANVMRGLNGFIEKELDRDRTLGHSYFMTTKRHGTSTKLARFKKTWVYQIVPLLREYFIGNEEALREYLGEDMLNVSGLDGFSDIRFIEFLHALSYESQEDQEDGE